MRSRIRGLRARLWALLAVATTVGVAAGFAALVATAWAVALPMGARADVAGSAADVIVITKPASDTVDPARLNSFLEHAVSTDAPGVFTIAEVASSKAYKLPTSTNDDITEIYAVDVPAVRDHSVLSAGVWPEAATVAGPGAAPTGSPAACTKVMDIGSTIDGAAPPPCAVVPAALPTAVASRLNLHVGDHLTVSSSPGYPPVTFAIVGEYQLSSAAAQPALAWNETPAGIHYGSVVTTFGPMAVAPGAFAVGALPYGKIQWTLVPVGAPSTGTLHAAITAIAADKRLSDQGYLRNPLLADELSDVGRRTTAAEAQLLAAAVLLGLLAGLSVAAAAGNLVGRGAAQAALMRSRGAPTWKLAAVYVPDIAVLFLAAAAGILAQGPLLGRAVLRLAAPAGGPAGLPGPGLGQSTAGWTAGAAVAGVAAAIVLLRAVRAALPAQVAAAAGRQAAVTGMVRAGADVALLGLAAVALWQAANTGLATDGTDGGTSVVLITACAPALAVAAGAALCGRLVTGAALLSERFGARARTLPARLAAWELARTPLRHVVPALLSVAAVAGCGYAVAQHASWQRSAQDQAEFQVGADVALQLGRAAALDEAGRLTRAAGVLDATPVYRSLPETGPAVVGLDAATAARTSLLRPDQVGGSPAALWARITPSARVGIALPGRPERIRLAAKLTAPHLTGATVSVTVADASGLFYPVGLGTLPADGAQHALTARLAPDADGLPYPLRLVGVELHYPMSSRVRSAPDFTVGQVAEQQTGAAAFTPVPGARAAMQSWKSGTYGTDAGQTTTSRSSGTEAVLPAVATSEYLAAAHRKIGSTVSAKVDRTTLQLHIVGVVSAFPALGDITNGQVLIVDLGALSDQAILHNDPLTPPLTWWLHTANGAVPPTLPVAARAAAARQTGAALLADPLAAVPQRVLVVGPAALVLLALLGLLVSLLATAREASARDTVLSALGMTRGQRAALACILHTAVALPAVVLGAGLGLLLSRVLVPVFVLSPQAAAPQPPATVLFAAGWPAAAAAALVGLTALAAFAASARRRDPSAASRLGG
ncbi:FtsX-like permease family protein [Peterkaempfera griseoplana]|uniref:FtsX-like permease family protein n=1 Tax=Peterkaempfera griseoplana TaxID=66896 RepID=UPI0006E1902D|nr:FtsX-like permease family protein [Peterkaempfera griseoplana]